MQGRGTVSQLTESMSPIYGHSLAPDSHAKSHGPKKELRTAKELLRDKEQWEETFPVTEFLI